MLFYVCDVNRNGILRRFDLFLLGEVHRRAAMAMGFQQFRDHSCEVRSVLDSFRVSAKLRLCKWYLISSGLVLAFPVPPTTKYS